MEAAVVRNRPRAQENARKLQLTAAAVGGAYLLWVGFDWVGNPLSSFLPTAYVATGLVAMAIFANIVQGMLFPYRSELAGGGYEKSLAYVDVLTSVGQVLTAFTAGITQAFARPLGSIVQDLGRMLLYPARLNRMYRETRKTPDE